MSTQESGEPEAVSYDGVGMTYSTATGARPGASRHHAGSAARPFRIDRRPQRLRQEQPADADGGAPVLHPRADPH